MKSKGKRYFIMHHRIKTSILFVFSLFIFNTLYSQIVFEQTGYQFGELKNWSQNPAIFEFYNAGTQQDAFLKSVKNPNVHVKYPNTYIEPGSSGKVLVYFEPQNIGRFTEKIKIYTVWSEKPVELTISGMVTDVLECPNLNLPADPRLLVSEQIIEVIDKNTRKPIYQADVSAIASNGKTFTRKTNRQGLINLTLETGMYLIKASATGYYPAEDYYYLNKNTLKTTIELSPVSDMSFENPEIVQPDTQMTTKKNKPEPGKIVGFVVDSLTRQPVERAFVRLSADGQVSKTYTTIADGFFSFSANNGSYQLHATASGYFPWKKSISIQLQMDTLIIEMSASKPVEEKKPPASREYLEISGIVIDAVTEKPVSNAAIKFYDQYNVPSVYTTFKDGRFRKNLKKGEYHVTIKAKGYQFYEDTLQVEKSRTGIVYILLPEDFRITTETPVPEKTDIPVLSSDTTTELLPKELFAANNIVFLIDVSSSMKQYHKLEYLKISMIRLTKVLRDIDKVSLISFSTKPKVHFISVPTDHKDTIISTIQEMEASGLTYGIQGLESAYQIATDHFIEGGNNQLIIATDGDFNSPDFSELELINLISKYASKGISLSVIGFKTDDKSIRRMKRMAAFGKGSLLVIENEEQAKSLLIDEIREKSRKKE
ncbi:MAG: VWA domain-containing protein [Sphingobacteriales bacterium]|nr:VWA domain-containing protein [Sphingobacteriales bacterium]